MYNMLLSVIISAADLMPTIIDINVSPRPIVRHIEVPSEVVLNISHINGASFPEVTNATNLNLTFGFYAEMDCAMLNRSCALEDIDLSVDELDLQVGLNKSQYTTITTRFVITYDVI